MVSLSAFPYFGGKGFPRIMKAVLAALPGHERYVEPFGGGASILLNKEPAAVEVYNDVNRGLVSFFRVVADPARFALFLTRVQGMPVSREIYEECVRSWSAIHDPVEQAVRWYYVARLSFGGQHGNAFGSTVNSSSRGMAASAGRWLSAIDKLPAIHDRMQRVQIECCDWRVVLERYSGSGWLAYCDPPYVTGARRAGGYEHELADRDHREMVDRLLAYDGAVVLSGYHTPIYAPLEAAGWDVLEVPTVCSAAGRTRASGLQGRGNVKRRQPRTEVLWIKAG